MGGRRAARLGGQVHGIFLWDGTGGDGAGGTAHMVKTLRDRGGDVTIIDPADPLWAIGGSRSA